MKKTEIVDALIEINKRLDSISIHNLISEIVESNNLKCSDPNCVCKTEETKAESPGIGIGIIAGEAGKEEVIDKLKVLLDTLRSGDMEKLRELGKLSEEKIGKKKADKIREMVEKSFRNK